jgi:hypothetical protein
VKDSPVLTQSAAIKRRRIEVAVHIGGALALVSYLCAGAIVGLRQQDISLPPEEVDCEYRLAFARERLVVELDSPPRTFLQSSSALNSDSSLEVQLLLRRSLEICATKEPQSAQAWQSVVQSYDDIVEMRAHQAEIRNHFTHES